MEYEEHEVGANYVRTNPVRLSKPGVWEKVARGYQKFNTHLTLAQLASNNLSKEDLADIHTRIVSGEHEED